MANKRHIKIAGFRSSQEGFEEESLRVIPPYLSHREKYITTRPGEHSSIVQSNNDTYTHLPPAQ